MGRDIGPKNKRSRREGKDLFGTGGKQLERRLKQPPGVHGKRLVRRHSEFSKQLREKQKVKRMYGLRESQFRRFYEIAQGSKEQSGLALLTLLERRLDNVIYRLGLARTRLHARQLVGHGHVLVNGEKNNLPSYIVNPGEVIELREKSRQIPDVLQSIDETMTVPGWLARRDSGGEVLREPERSEIDQDINERLIVEFYSR